MSMPIKLFLKVMCVSTLGIGALVVGSSQIFAQRAPGLTDPGYGFHMQKREAKKEKESESGLTFSADEINRWMLIQEKYTEHYGARVNGVMSGEIDAERAITIMRSLYPRTPYYDPFGELTIEKMTVQAYTADVSDDQTEINEALDAYRDLLRKHLANLSVVEYALTLSHADPIYGDSLRLKKIRDALHKNIIGVERNGESPEEAFKVVTYGEETYVLGQKNVIVKKSEIYRVRDSFFNVHDVVYEDGQYSQLFFDVTWPIYMYEKTKALRERKDVVSIPLQ
ncbi:MAG: hypothetical protein KAJ29_05625 [Alphaproteobacteria bacterium]|nr:hypothetical protein [Alphaproteobacteria bacterium]